MDEDDRWKVLIEEQTGSGENRNWSLTEIRSAGPEHDDAVGQAAALARGYQPNHPWSPRGRSLYRTADGAWLVVVRGATRSFHFRVTIAEHIETID